MDEVRTVGPLAATIQQRGDRVEKITCTMPDCRAPVCREDAKITLSAGLRMITYHLFAFHAAAGQMPHDISLDFSERDADEVRRVWIKL